MAIFAELGGKLKQFYGRWSQVIDAAGRFLCALVVFLWLRGVLNGSGGPFLIPVLLVFSVLTAAIGAGTITVIVTIMIAAASFGYGIDTAAVTCAVLLILYLTCLRLVPEHLVYAAAVPFAMYFGFSALIPVYLGIRKRPSSLLSVIPGAVIYYLISALTRTDELFAGLETGDYPGRLKNLIEAVFCDELLITVIGMSCALVMTYTVRRLSFDYAFYAAAAFGACVYLLFIILGNSVLHTEFSTLPEIVGTSASCAVLLLLLLIMLPLEFRKSENLRFEDDDYYYYVKAVPKITPDSVFDEDEEEEEEEETADEPVRESHRLRIKED